MVNVRARFSDRVKFRVRFRVRARVRVIAFLSMTVLVKGDTHCK